MSKQAYDWQRWINQKGVRELKVSWALEYLSSKQAPHQPYMEHTNEAFLTRWITALAKDEATTKLLKQMRLAWNVKYHRVKARHASKKSYTFIMDTSIEPKLRRLARSIGTRSLAETVEYLIAAGADLDSELRKLAKQQIDEEKKKLNIKHSRQKLKPTLKEQLLSRKVRELNERVTNLEKAPEDDHEA